MEEGMREGARQQRTIEARERATNEARKERRKEQHAAAAFSDDGSECSRRSVAVAPRFVPLPPSLVKGGKGRKKKGKGDGPNWHRIGKEQEATDITTRRRDTK